VGLDGLKNGPGAGFAGGEGVPVDLADIMEQMFGVHLSSMGGGGTSRRTADAVRVYEVTLEELYVGKHVKFSSKRKVVCPTCKGTGGKPNAKPKKCPACSGTGQKTMVDMFQRYMHVVCSDCKGTGEILHAKDLCKKCKGTKLVEEKKTLEFWVEKGMRDGEKIVLKGEADQEPGKETGDVVFVIQATDHPVFQRLGDDLKAKLHITLQEALCGFSRVILTTLDGRGLSYTHDAKSGKVIRPGEFFKIPGEGMPAGKKSDAKGDLYVEVEIEFPENGWMTDPKKIEELRSLLSMKSSKEPEKKDPEIVDEVVMEEVSVSDVEDGHEHGWETESDGVSDGAPEQCATQ